MGNLRLVVMNNIADLGDKINNQLLMIDSVMVRVRLK